MNVVVDDDGANKLDRYKFKILTEFDRGLLKRVTPNIKTILPSVMDIESEKKDVEALVKEMQSGVIEKHKLSLKSPKRTSQLTRDVDVQNLKVNSLTQVEETNKKVKSDVGSISPAPSRPQTYFDTKIIRRILAEDKVNQPIYELMLEDRFATNIHIKNFDRNSLKKSRKEGFEKALQNETSNRITVTLENDEFQSNSNRYKPDKTMHLINPALEKSKERSIEEIRVFNFEKLKHTETQERLRLPTKDDIESDRTTRDRIYPQEVLGFYSEILPSCSTSDISTLGSTDNLN